MLHTTPDTVTGFSATTSVPLFWRADGPVDAPPLVLLHGGPGAHHDYLYPQLLALAATHRVFTYDQRGGGQSKTDDPTPVTWQVHVADLARLLQEWQPQAPALAAPVVVGYSWGALLALLYAAATTPGALPDHGVPGSDLLPPRDRWPAPSRLALLSPAPVTRIWRDQFEAALAERQRAPAIAALRDALRESGLRERDPEAYRHRAFELSVAGYFADPARAVSLTPFRVTGRVQQSVWDSLGVFDLTAALHAVRRGAATPSLVVHGWQDPIPMASAAAVAESLGASLVALEDCGHVPYVERPAALFEALDAFLPA
ncbi:MAG: alpha/beta hydrolase [Gemmatimonadetes bacterium]|nr:alpha/beta hydrolase [Gemmatimonadota bacterium]